MIESIEFTNFKALRKTTLPLAPFTLLLGPNGSGKTSVLQALMDIATLSSRVAADSPHVVAPAELDWPSILSVTANGQQTRVQIKLSMRFSEQSIDATFQWYPDGKVSRQLNLKDGKAVTEGHEADEPLLWLKKMVVYSLNFAAIAEATPVNSSPVLQSDGGGLAVVLDDLRDNYPERWELLLRELGSWLPEYDQILFDKPKNGHKSIVLRTTKGGHRIPANNLSQGTLIGLALLTIAYLPEPPSLVGLEEIDRGLHPRLLRHLKDALYRLSYPESCGESRPPIQVIATTHSPYLLDLYREHPDEVILAEKKGLEVEMRRLSDIEHYTEIIGDSPLSDVWYSGVLGGVSVKP